MRNHNYYLPKHCTEEEIHKDLKCHLRPCLPTRNIYIYIYIYIYYAW